MLKHEDDKLEGESGFEMENNISESIYPNAEVRVEKANFSILHLKRLVEDRKELILAPKYQRENVWDSKQKSELIESILMGIPIPIIYLFETREGTKQVIDGRQRISTILDFFNGKFELKDLRILQNIKGYFNKLEPKLQGIFEDYQISSYIIQPPTPERVKYDIFDRVNRGGTRLNNQEMRNALYQGKATELLNDLCKTPAFLKATDKGISPKRMKDKYIILRAVSFYMLRKNMLARIEFTGDLHDFLAKTMIFINNEIDTSKIDEIKNEFIKSMENTYKVLGNNAFRFNGNGNKRPINMALFEAISYLFTFDEVNTNPDFTKQKVNELKRQFDISGKFSGVVDNTPGVNYRFDEIESLIKEL